MKTNNNSQESLYQQFIKDWKKNDFIEARTSGSTGKPKLIHLPKKQVIASAERTNRFFGITKDSKLHSSISFNYIGGKMMIVRSLVAGCNLTFEEPSLNISLPVSDSIDLISVTPPQLIHILKNVENFKKVRNILVGGAAINPVIFEQLIRSGLNFWESYAMTETATHIAMKHVGWDNNFRIMENVTIETDEDGSLIIHDGEYTVHTNDLAEIFDDGTFRIIGRKDDVINTGAKKVHPLELERLLSKYIPSSEYEYFITSRADEKWGQAIVLVVSPACKAEKDLIQTQGEEDKTVAEISAKLQGIIFRIPETVIPRWMKPKNILIYKELPRTDNGKVNRILKSSST